MIHTRLKADFRERLRDVAENVRSLPNEPAWDSVAKGWIYLRQAHKVLTRDFRTAFADQDWNISVRRSQESMEFSVKGSLLVLSETSSKSRFPVRERSNLRIKRPTLAFQVTGDPSLGDYAFLYWNGGATGSVGLLHEAGEGILTRLAPMDAKAVAEPFDLAVMDRMILDALSAQAPGLRQKPGPARGWTQAPIADDQRKAVLACARPLIEQRQAAFHFDQIFTQADAARAARQAWSVLRILLTGLGASL